MSQPPTPSTHATILNSLVNLGYVDKEDMPKQLTGAASMEDTKDFLFDSINDLGVANKDLLFLGTITSLHSFTTLIRQLHSLEILKLVSEPADVNDKAGENGKNERPRQTIAITSREKSKDIVALNYIPNHQDADDLRVLIVQALDALRPDGYLVVREYLHGRTDGDDLTDKYFVRDPAKTCTLLNSVVSSSGREGLQLMFAFTPDPQRLGGKTEITWLYQKVAADTPAKKLQEFLDVQQYSKRGILKYEKIFGDQYVSTGGEKTTKEFCELLNLQRNQKVLDVGCGIGGSAFYMAKEYGVLVHGMDLSSNMVSIAIDRRHRGGFRGVDFEIGNVLTRDYPANSFDVAYSRDVILHIADKKKLFQDLFKWLKPGGKVFITDYCCGVAEHSQDFKDYVKQREYVLLTVPDYGKLLEEVGFSNVRAEDRTKQFIKILSSELAKFEPQRAEFVKQFSEADYDEIVNGWNAKIRRCHAGDQVWGLFLAEKKG